MRDTNRVLLRLRLHTVQYLLIFLLLKCIAIYVSLKPKKSATMMRTLSGLWMRILTTKIDIRTSSNFYTNFIIS